MLSALNEKGQLIHLIDQLPAQQSFTCPVCLSALRLKKGQIMRPHFAHVSRKNCPFFQENESAEHLSLKAALYQSLVADASVQVEVFLPEMKQLADLLVNEELAIEVQCSRLSQKRLRERSQSYRQNGYQVLWLLGEKLWLGKTISLLQKDFLYFSQNMGFHLWELDWGKRVLRLKYLIYEDRKGRLHYLEKSCSFGPGLLAFLRLPFSSQPLPFYRTVSDRNLLSFIQQRLYYRDSRWLALQEQAYQQGENLLSKSLEAYYPQIRPLDCPLGFCQISQDLSVFSQDFFSYYQGQRDKSYQTLYPPAYYRRMKED